MKLKDQVISLELARKLEKLGVEQKSLFWWWKDALDRNRITMTPRLSTKYTSAFTVAELGEMLPKERISKHSESNDWVCGIQPENSNGFLNYSVAETEANARAKMLIYLLENGLIK